MTAAPEFGPAIPETAAPEVEFISLSHLNPSTELNPIPSRGIDLNRKIGGFGSDRVNRPRDTS